MNINQFLFKAEDPVITKPCTLNCWNCPYGSCLNCPEMYHYIVGLSHHGHCYNKGGFMLNYSFSAVSLSEMMQEVQPAGVSFIRKVVHRSRTSAKTWRLIVWIRIFFSLVDWFSWPWTWQQFKLFTVGYTLNFPTNTSLLLTNLYYVLFSAWKLSNEQKSCRC